MKETIKVFHEKFTKITVPLGYIMGIGGFVCLLTSDSQINWIWFVVLLFVSLFFASILTAIEIIRKKKYTNLSPNENTIAQKVKEVMSVWYEEEKYGEVTTFGRALGRALYISASYETRIEIGKLIRESAKHLEDDLLLTDVLLDDLGWTKFICGYKGAEDDIKEGIKLAEENHFYAELSKGYRHLTAIEISKWSMPDKAHEYLTKAFEACDKMDEGRQKEIVLSGLLFASSELAFKEKNYEDALKNAKESEKKRRAQNEVDRHMRVYAQIGKIELFKPKGNLHDARNFFRQGMDESESVGRIDELVKNAYGYAVCSIKLGEKNKAKKHTSEILKKYGDIPLYSEDELLRKEYKNITENSRKENNHGKN